jgi:membrane protein implicated in regulation of membrane protease activity
MDSRIFDRDTLLDLTVNVIPLGILAFFFVVFLVYAPGPFAFDSVFTTVQLAIVLTTFFLLAVLTYYAGKAVASAEKEPGIHAETATVEPDEIETNTDESA